MNSKNKLQTILFPIENWRVKDARDWLKINGYKSDDVDIRGNHLRFRQKRPLKKYEYYTVNLPNHVQLVFHK